jgi:hypothetical protein
MNIVEDFEEFKANLKEKWLDYYEANQELLQKLGTDFKSNDHWIFTLGVLSALDPQMTPKVEEWIDFYLTHIPVHIHSYSDKATKVVEFLGLKFDYEEELEKRAEEREKAQKTEPPSPLDDFRQLAKEMGK